MGESLTFKFYFDGGKERQIEIAPLAEMKVTEKASTKAEAFTAQITGRGRLKIKWLTPVAGAKIKSQRYFRYMRWIESVGKQRKGKKTDKRNASARRGDIRAAQIYGI
ncbi:MAG: hypothetical protein IJT73_03615 [Selenomonadaceae bacterium]|nr:hypothetical protein [Selenomonadaceae bacterium]